MNTSENNINIHVFNTNGCNINFTLNPICLITMLTHVNKQLKKVQVCGQEFGYSSWAKHSTWSPLCRELCFLNAVLLLLNYLTVSSVLLCLSYLVMLSYPINKKAREGQVYRHVWVLNLLVRQTCLECKREQKVNAVKKGLSLALSMGADIRINCIW